MSRVAIELSLYGKMTDFSETQKDYAIYLPAVSAVYSNHIGEQRYREFVKEDRLPFPMETLNFLNKKEGGFYYPWALYSAGHAKITLNKDGTIPASEDVWVNRNRKSLVLGDSGGFQIAMGRWKADWADPSCPKAKNYRETVLKWLERTADYGMILDVPTWGPDMSYDIAVAGTKINNDYFMKESTGACEFLNVLQGDKEQTQNSIDWYNDVKDYCDPKKYSNHLNGWSLAGSNARVSKQILLRLIDIVHDDLLQIGRHDWVHILGYSTMEWAIMLTAIQRSLRKHVNSNVSVSFDSASPYIQVSKASVYSHTSIIDGGRWSFGSGDGIDDKSKSFRGADSDSCREAWIGCNPRQWEASPISSNLRMGDICWYAPGERNKQGKLGKSSWDTFSYILQMAHNTHHHIKAIQEANLAYDNGKMPIGLMDKSHTHVKIENIVDDIFKSESKQKALDIIKKNDRFLRKIQDNKFAPKDMALDHLDLNIKDNTNKDKTFKSETTRKQHLKQSTADDWFEEV